jgi:hypothetical protein
MAVESIFLLGILINLLSYSVGMYLIISKKYGKTFLTTLKEGWSVKYISTNILNLSLLITSTTLFWFMIYLSSNLKLLTIDECFQKNPFLTCYIFSSSFALIPYSIYVSLQNFKKFKDLTSALGILSLWNGLDDFMGFIGGNLLFTPLTGISKFVKKNLVQSQLNQVLITSIVWMVFEYLYKISIVLCLVYLQTSTSITGIF